MDYLDLAFALQKLGQAANADQVRAMATKLIHSILGTGSGISSDGNASLKVSDLSSIDTLFNFLKTHNVAYNGYPIVSTTERGDGDAFWNNLYINKAALTQYLDHLHSVIKDPVNKPKLDAIISQVNTGLELDYKHEDKKPDAAKPDAKQEDKPETKPQADKQDTKAKETDLVRPFDGQTIDLGNIKDWLTALQGMAMTTKYKGIARYQGVIQQAISEIAVLIGMNITGDAPIFLGQPLTTLYQHVKQRGLELSNNNPGVALNFTNFYLDKMLVFLGTVQQVLSSEALMFPNKQDEIRQQSQFAQQAEVQVRQWQSQLPMVQQQIEGHR
jgi:hypothetical protein